MRIDSEHAVDASNDSSGRSADNPTNKATDRAENAVTGIGTAVCPVVHPTRHALRLCTDRRGEKEADSNHTEYSHLVSLFICATQSCTTMLAVVRLQPGTIPASDGGRRRGDWQEARAGGIGNLPLGISGNVQAPRPNAHAAVSAESSPQSSRCGWFQFGKPRSFMHCST
jgi:hypothetical protein